MPRLTKKNRINRRRSLKNKIAKKQYGSGYSFGVDQPPIAGQAEVITYSDCGNVRVPTPIDQSVGNLVPSGNSAGGSCPDIPSSQTIQTALNAPEVTNMQYTNPGQTGGKRRRRKSRKNKNTKRPKNSKKNRKGKKKRKVRKSKK